MTLTPALTLTLTLALTLALALTLTLTLTLTRLPGGGQAAGWPRGAAGGGCVLPPVHRGHLRRPHRHRSGGGAPGIPGRRRALPQGVLGATHYLLLTTHYSLLTTHYLLRCSASPTCTTSTLCSRPRAAPSPPRSSRRVPHTNPNPNPSPHPHPNPNPHSSSCSRSEHWGGAAS